MMETTQNIEKISVLGIGKAGVRIADTLFKLSESAWLNIGIADTDKNSLSGGPSVINVYEMGFEWTQGLGCGGDVLKGERAFAHHSSKNRLENFFTGATMAIIVGGMGGGTATGGASVLARMLRKIKVPSVFLFSIPFSFEGHSRRNIAENGTKMLTQDADVVISIPNDILLSSLPADTSAEDAFRKADSEIARGILGIAEIARCKNLLSADFSELKNVLNRRKNTCSIGLGMASSSEGLHRSFIALERALSSPLLGGAEQLKSADGAIITITGGNDLNIGEVRQSLESVERYIRREAKLITGANIDSAYGDKIQITIVTIHYDNSSETSPEHEFTKNNFSAQPDVVPVVDLPIQGELALMSISKGIFTNTSKNVLFGEDLDIPTFQRKGIHLDRGK